MELDEDFVIDAVISMSERCRRAREMGGIAAMDAFDGTKVPDGWVFDPATAYWVPRPLDAIVN